MGNPDKIVIFNDSTPITIKGQDYNTSDEAIDKAIAKFRERAKYEIDFWYKMEKENPESVENTYDIQGAWKIDSMKVYDL